MDKLTELAIKYGTDKWGKHHYTPVYFDLFHNKSKRRAIKKLLEIGPAEGAGLKMFRDFLPQATIYGAEIDQKRVDALQNLDRIKVYQCDQSQGNDLKRLLDQTGADLDVVIDDGSHIPSHQVFSCFMLMPLLPQDVIYVIEDVADPSIEEKLKMYDCELVKVGERYDDQLLIVRKRDRKTNA